MDERLALIALSRIMGLHTFTKKAIVDSVESVAALFQGKTAHGDGEVRSRMASFDKWKELGREMKELERTGVEVVTIRDDSYPALLRQIPDPPVVFYRKGPMAIPSATLAIVGSRKATFEGMNLAEKAAQTLSSLGITVVSGFARGIDSSAHKGALKERGKTIAVFGCGIDICYPSENRALFERVGEEGVLLTEYGLGEQPLPYHFPERNRIIAGLAKGVLVVEASQKSGSLITARFALDYGREVMSVPGSVFNEGHRGANLLIKQGARLIDSVEDIVAGCFPGLRLATVQEVDMNGDEGYIYSILGSERVHVDEIIDKSRMETKNVMSVLTRLEMKDLVRQFPGGFYMKK
jgi:DNA processing protein